MTTYSQFQPTGFDARGLGLEDRQDWLVAPVSITRDTPRGLETANFESCLETLGGESDTVEVHCFNHWGPGWFEIILVHPSRALELEDIERALEDYPVLDEEKWSEHESEEAEEAWENYARRDFERAIIRAFQLEELPHCESIIEETEVTDGLRYLAANRVGWEVEHSNEGARFNIDDMVRALTIDDVAQAIRAYRNQ